MIGNFVSARSSKLGNVLVVAILNGTPHPKAVCCKPNGSVVVLDVTELSIDWHQDDAGRWVPDHPEEET